MSLPVIKVGPPVTEAAEGVQEVVDGLWAELSDDLVQGVDRLLVSHSASE
jgi:hypothetical protein